MSTRVSTLGFALDRQAKAPVVWAALLAGAALAWAAASPLALLALAVDGTLSRLDGALLLVWFALALGWVVRSGRGLAGGERSSRRRFALPRLLAGLGLLTGGGWMLGDGLERIVRGFGVSESLLGNTAVAAAVEGEEVARVAVPARRGRGWR